MNTNTRCFILQIVVCSFAVYSSSAATLWQGAFDSDFANATNWNNNSPGNAANDGADNIATIDNGDTVDLTGTYTSTNPFRLDIDGNSTLNVSGTVDATRLNVAAGSTINFLDGSMFTLPPTGGTPSNIGGYTLAGDVVFSGGTHVFNGRMFGATSFRVEGNDSDITFHQIIGDANRSYEFIFDSTGVSNFFGAGVSGAGPFWGLNGSSLFVDASAFSGEGTFNLFETTSNAFSTFDPADITVVGAGVEDTSGGPGWQIINRTDGGRSFVDLVITIPEPSSAIALLLMGGLAVAHRRRRS